MARAGVLLDVDGTLVDTNYLHTLAWSRAFDDVGEWAPMNAIHRLVGMGGDQLVPEVLGHESPDAEAVRGDRYKELIAEAKVFPRARALLWRLHELSLAVVLATSSPKDELEVLLDKIDCDDAIDAMTTADDVETTKPAPEVFRAALRAGDVDPGLALVIGDSVWDVQAARSTGLACVGVETGGFSAHELREEGAMQVYRDVAELLDQIQVGPLSPLIAAAASPVHR